MSDIKVGDRINLIGDPEKESFVVLISEPDISGEIVVKDNFTGEYLMILLDDCEKIVETFTGRFWLATCGAIYFAVEDMTVAWNAGFKQFQGLVNIPDTMPGFVKWLTGTIEVEYT
jgi:hypothetical protein